MPTSITTAPGLIMSAVIIRGRPTATTRMSARRVWAARSRVLLLHSVTVAPACSSRCSCGLPTRLLAPTITASAPRRGTPVVSSRRITPSGVQGTSCGAPVISAPALAT